jgi:hypothetical protein
MKRGKIKIYEEKRRFRRTQAAAFAANRRTFIPKIHTEP